MAGLEWEQIFQTVGPNISEKFVPGGTNFRGVQIKRDRPAGHMLRSNRSVCFIWNALVAAAETTNMWCTHREVQGMLPNKSSEDLETKKLLI